MGVGTTTFAMIFCDICALVICVAAVDGKRYEGGVQKLEAEPGRTGATTIRKLLSTQDDAWSSIVEKNSTNNNDMIDVHVLDKMLELLRITDRPKYQAKEMDNGIPHADVNASTSLSVLSSEHLLSNYGTDGMLSQIQFKEASLEIFQCLTNENCTFETIHDEPRRQAGIHTPRILAENDHGHDHGGGDDEHHDPDHGEGDSNHHDHDHGEGDTNHHDHGEGESNHQGHDHIEGDCNHQGHDHGEGHNDGKEKSASDGLKLILIFVILASGVLGGLIPLAFQQISAEMYSRCLGLMNSFAGGVFLSTCLTHLLPHALEEAVAFETGRFPLQYFVIMMGYFALLLFERVIFHKRDACTAVRNDHGDEDAVMRMSEEKVDEEKAEKPRGMDWWEIRMELISLLTVSLHAVLAGLTLGMADEEEGAMMIFWAIFSHKSVEAFALGAKFMRANVSMVQFLMLAIAFSLVTPVGGLIGIALQDLSLALRATLNCISTGAFLYMGTIDVVLDEMTSTPMEGEGASQKRVTKAAAMFIGIITVCLLVMSVEHDHEHDDGHGH